MKAEVEEEVLEGGMKAAGRKEEDWILNRALRSLRENLGSRPGRVFHRWDSWIKMSDGICITIS